MIRIWVLSINNLRENLREKVLYNSLIFALLMIAASLLLIHLNVGDSHRLIVDLGVASLNVFGTMVAMLIGSYTINREVEQKTIYAVLSKSVHRYEFVTAKYIGLVLTLLVNTAVLLMAFLIVLYVMGVVIEPVLFKAVLLIFLESMIVAAFGIFFTTFTTPTLSIICSVSLYATGHLLGNLRTLGQNFNKGGQVLIESLYYVLPNLEQFNVKARVVHHLDVASGEIFWALSYGLLYTAFLVLIAALIFERRDFC